MKVDPIFEKMAVAEDKIMVLVWGKRTPISQGGTPTRIGVVLSLALTWHCWAAGEQVHLRRTKSKRRVFIAGEARKRDLQNAIDRLPAGLMDDAVLHNEIDAILRQFEIDEAALVIWTVARWAIHRELPKILPSTN